MNSEELFYEYYDYAVTIARKYAKSIHCRYFDTDDAIQCGLIGLMEACDRYKEDCGTIFKSFAYIRVIGRIKDNLRQMSSIRKHYARLSNSSIKLYHGNDISYSAFPQIINYLSLYNPEPAIIDKIDVDKLHYHIMEVMKKLPSLQQHVLYSKFFGNISVLDLSHTLRKSLTTIQSVYSNGIKNFKKYYTMYNEHPDLFILQKEYPMLDDKEISSNFTPTQTPIPISLDVHAGEYWKHRLRPYTVYVVSVTQEIVTYSRTTTVCKTASRNRIVEIPKKVFCTQFAFVNYTTAKGNSVVESKKDESELDNIPPTTNVTPKTPNTKGNNLTRINHIKEISVSDYTHECLLRAVICESPVLITEADTIFKKFQSYDSVLAIIHDMVKQETWYDMKNRTRRELIMHQYINTYIDKTILCKNLDNSLAVIFTTSPDAITTQKARCTDENI